ncbi:MAG: hydrogenase iron-sulfur subunit [Pirellulales bacterium]|jgi:coenzyme F420-reducing hydrogenase delta subunit|nr:hydrogenase iron-sulfur subunit [Thermoguttaceae bacterium]MDD4785532.1 hydrogenase iron-sulfur subunit [Pirellulales bacterium]MDI9443499.1 hydrogenase iron-sulfur subunit [Planctomycetota bacterium]NLZ01008.1 hydrogenase iron-sulfur subunit [Pirellulaceae bacterium]
MLPGSREKVPRILILATEACAYPGADHVGQIHAEYPTNAYIVRVPAPVIFPESFYLRCFEKGIAGILVMSCGHECPYPGAYDALAARIGRVHQRMIERKLDTSRLRLCAICTVCSKAFLKEVQQMHEKLLQVDAEPQHAP